MKKFVRIESLKKKVSDCCHFFKMATVWFFAVIGVFVVVMMVYLHLSVGE